MAFFSTIPGWQFTSVSSVHDLFMHIIFCKNISCSQLNLAGYVAMNGKPQQRVVS